MTTNWYFDQIIDLHVEEEVMHVTLMISDYQLKMCASKTLRAWQPVYAAAIGKLLIYLSNDNFMLI
jgi:hypothetical protein